MSHTAIVSFRKTTTITTNDQRRNVYKIYRIGMFCFWCLHKLVLLDLYDNDGSKLYLFCDGFSGDFIICYLHIWSMAIVYFWLIDCCLRDVCCGRIHSNGVVQCMCCSNDRCRREREREIAHTVAITTREYLLLQQKNIISAVFGGWWIHHFNSQRPPLCIHCARTHRTKTFPKTLN